MVVIRSWVWLWVYFGILTSTTHMKNEEDVCSAHRTFDISTQFSFPFFIYNIEYGYFLPFAFLILFDFSEFLLYLCGFSFSLPWKWQWQPQRTYNKKRKTRIMIKESKMIFFLSLVVRLFFKWMTFVCFLFTINEFDRNTIVIIITKHGGSRTRKIEKKAKNPNKINTIKGKQNEKNPVIYL